MKPLPALLLGLILLISCGSPKSSLPEFGEDIYEAIKSQDYDRYARHSLLDNKELALELDVLFGGAVKKDQFDELDKKLRDNFNEIQEELFDRNIIWKKANFLGFNFFEQASESNYKMYYGKLNFEADGKKHVIHVGRIVQKGNGRYYLMGGHPLTM
jgi:hypothetical protein